MFKKPGFEKINFDPGRKKASPSGLHQLADEMYQYFGGRFSLYAHIIKLVGEQTAREWFSDSKQSKNPIKRFMFLYSEFRKSLVWTTEDAKNKKPPKTILNKNIKKQAE